MDQRAEDIRLNTICAQALYESLQQYHLEIQKPECKRHGLGFNMPYGHSAFDMHLNLMSYVGMEGVPVVGVLKITNDAIFREALLEDLNDHIDEILSRVLERIYRRGINLRDQAIKSLEDDIEKLKRMGAKEPDDLYKICKGG